MTPSNDQVLSLFSGAGGFSYGFHRAGLPPTFGVEINSDACATYEANVGAACLNLDLSIVAPAELKRKVGLRAPLAIIGGPPCQGFSTAGPRDHADPRNQLIFNYLAIVREIQPRWFVFENVEGLLTSGQGEAIEALTRSFISLGYSVRVEKINFAAYGLPQTRKRVLIIGNNLGVDFSLPPETHSYDSGKSNKLSDLPMAPTLDEALAGLPIASNDSSVETPYPSLFPMNSYDARMREGASSNGVTHHSQRVTKTEALRLAMLRPGQTMKDLPKELWHESFHRRASRRVRDGFPTEKRGGAPSGLKRLRGDKQSLTITGAATREFIHPHQDRPLTARECARIQSFPDQFNFRGGQASVIQQIGNAVPPLGAETLARHIQELDGAYGSDRSTEQRKRKPASLLGFFLTEASGKSPALQNTERRLLSLLPQD